jgi:hypothetical protein
MTTRWTRKAIRERISEIRVLLMFGPFPAPYTCLSGHLANELVILRSLLKRRSGGIIARQRRRNQ